jgi:hypothetical protein
MLPGSWHESDIVKCLSSDYRILKDAEYREIQRVARSRHISIVERLRQALDLARRREPGDSMGKTIEAVRRATQCRYPSGDI